MNSGHNIIIIEMVTGPSTLAGHGWLLSLRQMDTSCF